MNDGSAMGNSDTGLKKESMSRHMAFEKFIPRKDY